VNRSSSALSIDLRALNNVSFSGSIASKKGGINETTMNEMSIMRDSMLSLTDDKIVFTR